MRPWIGIFRFALGRSARNWRLLASSLLALVVAVGLVASIPLYSYGALNRLLRARVDNLLSLPPGVIWVKAMFFFPKPENVDQYKRLDAFVVQHSQSIVGLPQKHLFRYVASDLFLIWPYRPDGEPDRDYPRRMVTLVFQQDLMEHVRIVAGDGLPVGRVADGEDVPVVISAKAAALDVEVGERVAFSEFRDYDATSLPIRIVGVWEPIDPADAYWFHGSAECETCLFVDEDALTGNVLPRFPLFIREASWYGVYDETRLSSGNSGRVLAGIDYLKGQARLIVSNALVDTTLKQTLAIYERQATVLSTFLAVLSIPTVAAVLCFAGLSLRMVVERERGEIALLKSRGASTLQVVGVYFCQGLILGGAALALGPLVGVGIAQLVGQTSGFMRYARQPALAIALTPRVIELAGAAALLALPATVLPAIGAARRTIVGYKQETARSSERTVWRGVPFGLLLLAIAAYGYYLLRQHETILPLDKGESFVVDPLLVLVPAIFIFGAALLLQRLLTPITSAVARLVGLLPGPTVALALALRQLARAPGQHGSLVLLLTLAVALGTYSISTARTIDRNFADRVRYSQPGDLELWEYWGKGEGIGGDRSEEIGAGEVSGSGEEPNPGASSGGYYTEPSREVYAAPGVLGAVPFKHYEVTPGFGRSTQKGTLLALDRIQYAPAGWWRRDFAERPLGALLNALGADESASLVSRAFFAQSGLRLGDRYTLLFGEKRVDFFAAEVVDYFPTLDPRQGSFFVANLDYVYDQVGIEPYRVWVALEPGASRADAVEALREQGVPIEYVRDGDAIAGEVRADPQRTALFGVFTFGAAVVSLLVVLGFLQYSFLSYERRIVQLGILRALGLSIGQLLLVLAAEQALLVAVGGALGTGLGAIASYLFVPFLQVGTEGQTPRFVVELAWSDLRPVYAALGLVLLAGLAGTAWLVQHLQLHQAIKLGEEQ